MSSAGPQATIVFFLLLLALVVISSTGPRSQAAGFVCSISASAKGLDATFSGTISGYFSTPNWVLHFGDGGSDSGSGASVYDTYSYGALGTYTVTLTATTQSPTGGPESTSCSTRVTIQTTFTISAQDSVTVPDKATYVPPIHAVDSISVKDLAGNYIPRGANDSILVSDTPLTVGPGSFSDSSKLTDSAVVTLGSNAIATPLVLITVVVVSIVGAAIIAWRVILMRPSGR